MAKDASERNYFAYQSAARRYTSARPYFHPLVIRKIKDYLQLQEPLQRALDIGCGTGQSTVALKEIATDIVGTDISQEMLNEVPSDPHIQYLRAPAEQLPLPDASFDLVTVALAFHWFDRPRFLAEAWRVLRPAGWLVIYANGFTGTMAENPAFERWNWDSYVTRYPTPPRNNQPLTGDDARQHGFRFSGRETYTNDVLFSPEELANYLLTQSNVLAVIEQGSQRPEDVYAWVVASVTPLFKGPAGTFRFGGTIEYLQKERSPGRSA